MRKEKGLLSNTDDGLDVDDMIRAIEKTFKVDFNESDFKECKTYQNFEDVVFSKIKGKVVVDCTSQQAFYKLRSIISDQCGIDKSQLCPSSSLNEIFPRKNRFEDISKLNKELKTSVQILTFNNLQLLILLLSFLSGIVLLFFNFWLSVIFLMIGLILKDMIKTDKFCVSTLGDFAQALNIEDYKNSRRDQNSYNIDEVKFVIKSIFSENLSLKFHEVKPECIL